ncbi:MAG: helix-turn-helix transcriptional regulator, partial [Gemmatimonadales bacterium]|nr:helix-turn-helix transcriptional regulator [Gemmatimonadales bacterium]
MALLKGTLDALVLKALSSGPRHAFEITRWIEEGSAGEIPIEAPALLQALHRLEEKRLLTGEWG